MDKVNSRLDWLEEKNNHIDDRVNSLDSSVNSIDTKLNNFMIDQLKFNELTDKKICDWNEYTVRKFLENDTNVLHVQTDILNIKETVEGNTRKIQDITKLINIHKSEIWSELMESFNQFRYHLDQTVAHMANPWGQMSTDCQVIPPVFPTDKQH